MSSRPSIGNCRARVIPFLASAIVIALAGLTCFSTQLRTLWLAWTGDGLRSVGILIVPTSLFLSIRAWHQEKPRWGGTTWGLALIAGALALGILGGAAGPTLRRFAPASPMLPVGLLLYIYASGLVLYMGGFDFWRAAAFPLLLLALVNPVPAVLDARIDLPLQYTAAHLTRSFAHFLSIPVAGRGLELVFSQDQSVFIAPGCNGLRGAVAMGYVALIIGYLKNQSLLRRILFVIAASLFAYLLNLLRLFALVIFYWLAQTITPLADYGLLADYLIGALIFFAAAGFLLAAPRVVPSR